MTTTVTADPEARPAQKEATSGPVGRVVAAAMAAGLLGALLLTLVLLPGATESTALGSSLLAFSAGWVLLAVLSRRMTDQAQDWAFVPAVAMSGTGSALLALSPGDAALEALGWVWPPVVLVLAGWMQRRAKQQLPRAPRVWLVYPVLGFLTLASLGGGYQTVRASADSTAFPAPGALVDIGGRSVHLQCSGTGSPVVVLANGLGGHSTQWAWVRADVARSTTVCAYDRAGQAWSDDSASAPDGVQIADDLRALLTRAGLPGPYVLAGHSTGGLYAQVFADRYPDDVAGLVLIDSLTPRAMTALPSYPRFYETFRRSLGLFPSLARMGVGQLAFHSAGSSLPASERQAERALATSAKDQRSQRDEFAALPATFDQAERLSTLGDAPLAVVTAGKSMQAGWLSEQLRMTALSSNSAQRTVDLAHATMVQESAGAAVSSDAIAAVVTAVRTGGRVRLPSE